MLQAYLGEFLFAVRVLHPQSVVDVIFGLEQFGTQEDVEDNFWDPSVLVW